MSDPDQIRADIERTRADLGGDVDALAEKVNPSSIAHRQADKVKNRFSSIKESVMGSAHDARDSGSSAVGSAAGSVKDAGHGAVQKAKGNPLAVGLVAFGVGWLVSSLLPTSDAEKGLATTAKEKAQPLVEKVTDAAKESAQNLAEPAKDAANALKDTATQAASNVKDQAQGAAGDVKDSAQESRQNVQGQASQGSSSPQGY